MATEAQVSANRLNAQKSTGPRTEEGKAIAAQNALKHGLWAEEVVLKGEDAQEYERLREGRWREMAPVGDGETELAGRIIELHWKLRRVSRVQTRSFNSLYDKKVLARCGYVSKKKRQQALEAPANEWLATQVFLEDLTGDNVLDKLQVQERRIESCLYRTMDRLDRMQDRRRKAGAEHSEGLPQVATTNVAQDQGQICGTNPIGREADVGAGRASGGQDPPCSPESGRGRPPYEEETPDGVTTNAQPSQSCGTNPISEEVLCGPAEAPRGEQALETSDLKLETASCGTNPISGGAVESQVPATPEVKSDLELQKKPRFSHPLSLQEGLIGPIVPAVGVPWAPVAQVPAGG